MLLLSCADKVKQVWGHGNVTAYTNRQTKLLSFFFILNTTKSIYYYTFGVTFNFELTETCDLVQLLYYLLLNTHLDVVMIFYKWLLWIQLPL